MSTEVREDLRLSLGEGAIRHPDREQPFELGAPVFMPDVTGLSELLEHWADRRSGLACAYFIDMDNKVSTLRWGELRDAASRWAGAMAARGVRPLDRVLLALPTSAALLTAFFACQWLGATPCIVEAPVHGKGLASWCDRVLPKLSLVEPRLIITEASLTDLVQAGLAQLGSVQQVVDPALLASGRGLPRCAANSAPAILQFTSGTTSQPKAVVCSPSAVLANLRGIGGDCRQFHAGDLMLGWLPLFHDMGLVATTLSALAHGIPVALMPPAAFVLRPARWLWAAHMFRASLAFAPNFAFRLCLRRLGEGHAELAGLDLSAWRCIFNAAEFIHADTARAFSARYAAYGLPAQALTPAYGMAEMTVGVSSRESGAPLHVDVISRAELGRDRAQPSPPGSADAIELVSLGRVFAGHELAIHDEHGQPLPERCQGEIVLRGPSLFDGYYRDPVATREVSRAGWLRTGDLGYLAQGEVYITGRCKDLIIRGGENLHPHLLEEAASGVPGVRAGRVAAVGLLSALAGTEEIALLVETGETAPENLRRLRYEIENAVQRSTGLRPDHVLLVAPNSVPVTTSGKIRRASARETILRNLAREAPSASTFGSRADPRAST
jgi:acyl-CoA synthetase (AMP-forming)/AMP-acid ligase II